MLHQGARRAALTRPFGRVGALGRSRVPGTSSLGRAPLQTSASARRQAACLATPQSSPQWHAGGHHEYKLAVLESGWADIDGIFFKKKRASRIEIDMKPANPQLGTVCIYFSEPTRKPGPLPLVEFLELFSIRDVRAFLKNVMDIQLQDHHQGLSCAELLSQADVRNAINTWVTMADGPKRFALTLHRDQAHTKVGIQRLVLMQHTATIPMSPDDWPVLSQQVWNSLTQEQQERFRVDSQYAQLCVRVWEMVPHVIKRAQDELGDHLGQAMPHLPDDPQDALRLLKFREVLMQIAALDSELRLRGTTADGDEEDLLYIMLFRSTAMPDEWSIKVGFTKRKKDDRPQEKLDVLLIEEAGSRYLKDNYISLVDEPVSYFVYTALPRSAQRLAKGLTKGLMLMATGPWAGKATPRVAARDNASKRDITGGISTEVMLEAEDGVLGYCKAVLQETAHTSEMTTAAGAMMIDKSRSVEVAGKPFETLASYRHAAAVECFEVFTCASLRVRGVRKGTKKKACKVPHSSS